MPSLIKGLADFVKRNEKKVVAEELSTAELNKRAKAQSEQLKKSAADRERLRKEKEAAQRLELKDEQRRVMAKIVPPKPRVVNIPNNASKADIARLSTGDLYGGKRAPSTADFRKAQEDARRAELARRKPKVEIDAETRKVLREREDLEKQLKETQAKLSDPKNSKYGPELRARRDSLERRLSTDPKFRGGR